MEEYIGDIKLFAGTYCPQNYMYCNGQAVAIQQNPALFSVLGTQYGGNGSQTFCLPNLNKNAIIEGTNLKYIICTQGLYPVRPDWFMANSQKISTPCIRYCKLKDGICEGCSRTWEQIRDWTSYSENTRLEVMKSLIPNPKIKSKFD